VGLRHKMNHCTLNLNGLFVSINIIENEKETPLETSKYEPINCKVYIFFSCHANVQSLYLLVQG
jgi:hypothetical protein